MHRPKHLRSMAATLALCAALPCAALADAASASATSAPTPVDTTGGALRAVSPRDVGYSPDWCGASASGAYVVIEKVLHAGMNNAVTSTVATCAADAEGVVAFSLAAGDDPCVRLLHTVRSSGGAKLGETLARDVAFGVSSQPSAPVAADCRAGSLAEAVARRGGTPVMLAYDTAWATNGTPASVSIESILLDAEGGTETGASHPVFTAAADASGETRLTGTGRGWMRLALTVTDSSDNVLLRYLTGDFLLKDLATVINIR